MPLVLDSYVVGSKFYFFREGDTVNSVALAATRARASNVATVTTQSAHGLFNGALVTMTSFGGTGYNIGPVAVTVINATTFSFACTGANEASTADTAGVVMQTGVCSKILKPGPVDGGWIDLGLIESASIKRNKNEIKVYGGNPGVITLQRVLTNKQEVMMSFTTQDFGPFVLENIFLTTPLNGASSQFNVLSGSEKVGWLKWQAYSQKNASLVTLDSWVQLSITGDVGMGGQDIVKAPFEALFLQSPLGTATI